MNLKSLSSLASSHLRNLFKETSPASAYAAGAMPASIRVAKKLTERQRLADLLPYESYDEGTGLFYAEDAVSFMLEAAPAAGITEHQIKVLTGLFTQGLKEGTVVQVILYASPDVHPLLQGWVEARSEGGIFRHLAKKRQAYFNHGNWQSLLSAQPMLLRDFRLFITFTRPLPLTNLDPRHDETRIWWRPQCHQQQGGWRADATNA